MRPTHLLPAGGLTFALCLLPVVAQPPEKAAPKPVDLPVTRVVLFNAGVGYFVREGTVEGTAKVDLRFPEPDVNDLLKSLTLEDKDGGKTQAVTYDGKHPVEVTLKSFSIDLTEGFTVGQLLQQVRGEKVEVTDKTGSVTTGAIVGVEHAAPPEPGKPSEGDQLNLFTADGLQSVSLPKMKKIKFLKAELEAEFRAALEVLAAARGSAKKTVSLTFAGNGRRRVKVGYVTEAPMWKATYRLTVGDKADAKLQGWAVVENTTEDDWKDVKVGLVAGRPMAFEMDLYQPLFVPRPRVEPELYASLRPPVYQGNVNNPQMAGGLGVNNGAVLNNAMNFQQLQGVGGGFGGQGGGFGGQAGGTGFGGGQGGFGGQMGMGMTVNRASTREMLGNRLSYAELGQRVNSNMDAAGKARAPSTPLPYREVLSGAAAVSLGDFFEYKIADPVTLPRLKSALLPVVEEAVEVGRVSIYNEAVLAKHPLLGLRVANKTKLHLSQGPVTVYEGDTFAGDARLPDMKPGEARLVSYAIDLGVEVVPAHASPKFTITGVALEAGRIEYVNTTRYVHKFTVRNRNTTDRLVVIELPHGPGRKLVSPEKFAERTRDAYRFEVPVKADAAATLEVTEDQPTTTGMDLLTANDDVIRGFTREGIAAPVVKAALAQVLEKRAAMVAAARALADEQAALKAVTDDQTRIRANIERVPKDSEAYRRYLKKFDEQETQIEGYQAKIKQFTEKAATLDAEYKHFVAKLAAK